MKYLVTLASLIIPFMCHSQFEVHISGNVSILPDLSAYVGSAGAAPVTSGFSTINGGSYTINESYQSNYGFEVGVGYRKAFSDRLSLVSGINLSSISFKRDNEVIYDDIGTQNLNFGEIITSDGQPIGGGLLGQYYDFQNVEIEQTENVGETSLKYLAVPIDAEYGILKKVSVSLGVQAAYLIHSSETINQYVSNLSLGDFRQVEGEDPVLVIGSDVDSLFELEEVDDKSGDGYQRMNFSARLGINYKVLDKISLDARLTQGLHSIYKQEKEYAGGVRSRFVSLGLRYSL